VEADPLQRFEANRARLFGLAYRMLGEAGEAEDVVQDAYLRWTNSEAVAAPEAWLTRVVSNLCLNRLASARSRRERYVGSWLPEPVLTDTGVLGPLETVEQRDSVSVGMLVLLERLTPPERAVFVLREAFGYSHHEVAEILQIEVTHSRQLYRRARAHVGEPRKRFDADGEQRQELVEKFFAATIEGDIGGLERMLAEDVVAWADGGGEVPATRRPIHGRANVLRYLLVLRRRPEASRARATVAEVNGQPAIVLRDGGTVSAVMVPEVTDGRIVAVRTVVSARKLAFAAAQLM